MTATSPRVLFFDIETTPFLSYTWGKYQQDVIRFNEPWHLLCFAWKWMGEDEVHVLGQDDFPRAYKRNRRDDRQVAQALWNLLDQADIVIAHNGDRFDIRKVNARFAVHGLGRPSPYATIDTKKVSSRNFDLGSNSLNDLGDFFDLGHKLVHTGFDLWLGCMGGDPESWGMMKAYNQQDVRLLEALYYYLRDQGWIVNHPNMAVIAGQEGHCPKCLAAADQQVRRGHRVTAVNRYVVMQCKACKGYHRVRQADDLQVKYTSV